MRMSRRQLANLGTWRSLNAQSFIGKFLLRHIPLVPSPIRDVAPMASHSMLHTQTVPIFEEVMAEYTRVALQRGDLTVFDFTEATPDHEQTVKFDCGIGVQGRVTPFESMFILDFYNADGTRRVMNSSPHFSVLDISERPVMLKPVADTPAQYYYLSSHRKYEVHDDQQNRVIRHISFPPTILVQ